jgi:hypothetical protein
MKRSLGCLVFLILAPALGCQQGDRQTYANVKGTVTFNGKPLDKGEITFEVEGRPPSTTDIVDGKFAGQALVGSNKISVSAKKRSAAAAPKRPKYADEQEKAMREKAGSSAPDVDPSMVESIPPEWNTQSKHKRVVEAGAANDFEFHIKGQ